MLGRTPTTTGSAGGRPLGRLAISQRIHSPHPSKRPEVAIVSPDLRRAVVKCRQRDLEIKDPRPLDAEVRRKLDQPIRETFSRRPQLRFPVRHQSVEKRPCLRAARGAAGAGGMSNDAPELGKARQRDSPSSTIPAGPLDRALRGSVLHVLPRSSPQPLVHGSAVAHVEPRRQAAWVCYPTDGRAAAFPGLSASPTPSQLAAEAALDQAAEGGPGLGGLFLSRDKKVVREFQGRFHILLPILP